uniref:Ig-like domain-containing protein n=1 Tax=Takifugu rubripes TaxID=31033 RepID=A0A674N1Y9_TAKRU
MFITIESLKLASYLCLFLWTFVLTDETSSFVHPVNSFVFANIGENVTLQCSRKDEPVTAFFWYKQTQGDKPKLISTFYEDDVNVGFSKEFKNGRFSGNITEKNYHLTIASLSPLDSAVYYCGSSSMHEFKFEKIYIVHIPILHLTVPVEVHQSPSKSVQSGGFVTLNCRVHTGTCEEEHTVYWFKKSGESVPELIYTHGGKKEQCERKNTCFYNLPMRNLNTSKAGTYYCAVATCGQILFGNGTKLDIGQYGQNRASSSDKPVYFLTGALVFTTILCVLLALSLFKLHKRISSQNTGTPTDPSCDMTGSGQEKNLHYANISHQNLNKSRRITETSNCVYSFIQ